ncbi:DUF1016 N-terminal domain-containing protein [Leifsonia xyli]|uniref:DUF1016 N-terminal domain-containing protein n=1 Tax=Leifsonia xyli TaxID=1575 RepID=UPI00351C9369
MNELAVPANYPAVLADLRKRVRQARARTQRQVNAELVGLYWSIGTTILTQQNTAGWGAGVVEQLAMDLRATFPDMRGLSRRNLLYMRAFAAAWPEANMHEVVQQPVARNPLGPRHHPSRQARHPR